MSRDATGRKPASLPTLAKRQHVRVVLPQAVAVYARLRPPGSAAVGVRCVVNDISAGGMGVTVLEGGRHDLPQEGQEAVALLDHEGAEATVLARVVRASPNQASFAFPPATRDEQLNVPLLALIARVVTRRIDHVDRRRWGEALVGKLTHRMFHGAGCLDLRVQTEEPAWWQCVFLEYLMSWNQRDGRPATGTIDRSFSVERASDPLAVRPDVERHPAPWPKLLELAAIIAGLCAASRPEHADAFALMQRTLRGAQSAESELAGPKR